MKPLHKIITLNATLIILYLLANWAEYSAINRQFVATHFPTSIEYTLYSGPGMDIIIFPNLTLIIFLVAVFANLYLWNKGFARNPTKSK
jgi:hypothetical protein